MTFVHNICTTNTKTANTSKSAEKTTTKSIKGNLIKINKAKKKKKTEINNGKNNKKTLKIIISQKILVNK